MLKLSGNLTSTTAIGDAGEYVAPPTGAITTINGLFQNSEGGFWYDPSDNSTVKQENLTNADYGDRIRRILDKSGNGNTLEMRSLTTTNSNGQSVGHKLGAYYGSEPANGRRNIESHNQVVAVAPSRDGVASFTGVPSTITTVSTPAYASQHTNLGAATSQRFLVLENNNSNISSIEIAGNHADGLRIGKTYTLSVWVSEYTTSGNANSLVLISNGGNVTFTFSTGSFSATTAANVTYSATQHGNWYRISATHTAQDTAFSVGFFGANAGNYLTAGSGNGFYCMGMQVEEGTSATGLQITHNRHYAEEVGQSNVQYFAFFEEEDDVNTTGDKTDDTFFPRLMEKGTGVSLANADEITLFLSLLNRKPDYLGDTDRQSASVTPQEAYDDQTLLEFGDQAESSSGFKIFVDYDTTNDTTDINFLTCGGTNKTVTATNVGNETKKLITCLSDVSEDVCKIFVDGTIADTDTTDQGSGTFGTNSLNLGADGTNSVTNGFFGKVYQIVGRGAVTSDTDMGNINTIVASKAGLTV